MGRIEGRSAVITGAGDGIGYGIARRFAREGASIVVAEINEENGERVAAELRDEFGTRALFVLTDVASKADNIAAVDRCVDEFGTIDILVNNAWGGGAIGRVENKTDEQILDGYHVGFLGPFWAMQRAFPTMKAQQWGRIVNLCSLNGVNAHMGTLEYNTAKEALRALTRTAAREWAPHQIACNVICPAAKSASFRMVEKQNPEMIAAASAHNPMGRMGDCEEDIAPVALFLASEDARYVTGNTLFADGGGHINGSNWAPEMGEDQ